MRHWTNFLGEDRPYQCSTSIKISGQKLHKQKSYDKKSDRSETFRRYCMFSIIDFTLSNIDFTILVFFRWKIIIKSPDGDSNLRPLGIIISIKTSNRILTFSAIWLLGSRVCKRGHYLSPRGDGDKSKTLLGVPGDEINGNKIFKNQYISLDR